MAKDTSETKKDFSISMPMGEVLTKTRFNSELKTVAQYFSDFRKKYLAELVKMQSTLEKELEKINSENFSKNEVNKADIVASLAELESYKKRMEAVLLQKMAEVKNGEDADEDKIVDRATTRVKEELFIPSTEDLLNQIPTLAARVRDALELLEGDERLSVTAIKGLEEMFAEYDKGVKKAIGSIQVPSPVGWTKHQEISLSSGTTTYSLSDAPAHNGKAAIVRYEGQVLSDTTHYSFNGTDITLTFDPTDGTTLDVTYWPF